VVCQNTLNLAPGSDDGNVDLSDLVIVASFIAARVYAGRDARMVKELMQIKAHANACKTPCTSPLAK
jgi:hypothetical protein